MRNKNLEIQKHIHSPRVTSSSEKYSTSYKIGTTQYSYTQCKLFTFIHRLILLSRYIVVHLIYSFYIYL